MMNFLGCPYIAFDTEATGLRHPIDKAFGFGIALPDGKTAYWDIRFEPKIVEWWMEQMYHYKGRIICHNAAYDYLMATNAGIYLPIHQLDDTVIRAALINEHEGLYDLDSLTWTYCGFGKQEPWQNLALMFGGRPTRQAQAPNLQRAPSSLVAPYCEGDAIATLRLWEAQEKEIENQNDTKIPLRSIVDFERKLMPLVIRTQQRGVRVDLDEAEQAMRRLTPLIFEEQDKLNKIAGWDVNVNSSPQIKKIFEPKMTPGGWMAIDGTIVPRTKSGAPSFGADVLRTMSHPAAAIILETRSLLKTRDTFLGGHVLKHAVNGRVYPTINQSKSDEGAGVGPGRFSYTEPALQQIPSRNKTVAEIVKACFLPDEGQVWCETDMDTFEVRVFASLAGVPRMLAAYDKNPDLDGHQFVADLTGLPRGARFSGDPNAKQLNLAMIFNQGNGSTAEAMGMSWEWDEFEPSDKPGTMIRYKKAGAEAMAAIDKYHRFMPGVKELAKGCKNLAESRGFIRTAFGRRIRFPNGWKSYKASGLYIQATSADLNKENWMLIDEALDGEGHLILNTHDSYGLSLNEDTWLESFRQVRDSIQREGRIRVPLRLGLNGCGNNWWGAICDKLKANEANSRRGTKSRDKSVSRSAGIRGGRAVSAANSKKRKKSTA